MSLEDRLAHVRKTLKLFGMPPEVIEQEVWLACIALAGSPPGTRIEIVRDLYGMIHFGTIVPDEHLN